MHLKCAKITQIIWLNAKFGSENANKQCNLLRCCLGGYRVGDIYIPPPVKPYCSSESQGSRLIITQIMNTNFKSYAGDVPLGPFCHVSILVHIVKLEAIALLTSGQLMLNINLHLE